MPGGAKKRRRMRTRRKEEEEEEELRIYVYTCGGAQARQPLTFFTVHTPFPSLPCPALIVGVSERTRSRPMFITPHSPLPPPRLPLTRRTYIRNDIENSPPKRFPGSSARRLLRPVHQLHPESIGLPRGRAYLLLKRPRLLVPPSRFLLVPRVRLAPPAPLALVVQLFVQVLFLERIPGCRQRGKERYISIYCRSRQERKQYVGGVWTAGRGRGGWGGVG